MDPETRRLQHIEDYYSASKPLTAQQRPPEIGDILKGPDGWKFQMVDRGHAVYMESRRTFFMADTENSAPIRDYLNRSEYLKRADGGTITTP